eukprot:jgi/Tetstr1/463238/TSEL_008169.t1
MSSDQQRGRSASASGQAEPSPYLAHPSGRAAPHAGGRRPGAAPLPASTASVKASITYCVRVLRALGVGAGPAPALSAELLRQAKFDAPEAAAPLRRALHDLALLRLAGFPPGGGPRLAEFWSAMAARFRVTLPGDLPAPAALLLHDRLHAWGCPLRELLLGGAAGAGPVSSRLLLLALGWLAADSGALELAVERHAAAAAQPPHATASPLPPWPDDTSSLPEALAAGEAAATAAAAFSNELSARAARSRDGWAGVEARQHAALVLLGRVRAAAMALGAAQVARRRRAAAAYSLQDRLAAALDKPAPCPPLSPFELSLAMDPARADAAVHAAEASAARAAEAAAGAAHCEMFFAWLASVREEHFAQRPGAQRPAEPNADLLASGCAGGLAALEGAVLARQAPLEGAVAQALGVLEALEADVGHAPDDPAAAAGCLMRRRQRAVHLSLSASGGGPGGDVALAELDVPLPAELAAAVAAAARGPPSSALAGQLAPPAPRRTIAHVPEGAARGGAALPAASELAALKAANLAAARQLAHLSRRRQARRAAGGRQPGGAR